MAKSKITRRIGPAISGSKVLHLACGRDFFRSGFGYPDGDLAEMRKAWQDEEVRRLVYKRHWRKWGRSSRPWSEIAFGPTGEDNSTLGEDPKDLEGVMRQYQTEIYEAWEREIKPTIATGGSDVD